MSRHRNVRSPGGQIMLEIFGVGTATRATCEKRRSWLSIALVVVWAAMIAQGSVGWAGEGDLGPAKTLVRAEATGGKPLFVLPSLDGPRRALDQYRGRIVLVHFFATWCETCRPEMARLQDLRSRLDGKPFDIVAISVAEADSAVRRFFSMPPPFSILLDRDRAITKLWKIDKLPTSIVLDFRLQPRFIAEGDVDWAHEDVIDAVALLLKEAPAAPDVGRR
jgi:thiol-disulfide isomerase/thioredoxin